MRRFAGGFAKARGKLSAFCASLLERRVFVIGGLVLFAALPALVQFERRGSEDGMPDSSPFANMPLSSMEALSAWEDASSSARDTPGRPEMAELDAEVDVQWEARADVEIADERDDEAMDFDCMIEPWESVSIRSPVIGRIDAIHVERADLIEEGDLLLELDANLSKAELEVARQRADMGASIRAYEARKKLGAERGRRALELFSRNAIAPDERDEVLMEKDVTTFDLENAIDQQVLAQRQLDRARARYEQRRVHSPFAGIVADRLMSVGEVVDEETVLELAQIDPLRVEVVLPAIEFGTIHSGMKAAVVPEIPGDEVVVATVRVVDRIIDSASGTFGAELELPNPNHEIPGGLRCRVRFMEIPVESEEMARAESTAP